MAERTLISRDPFAREEITREIIHSPGQSCDWCGGHRYRKGKPLKSLFRYWLETDGGRNSPIRGLFCSNDCRESYHG